MEVILSVKGIGFTTGLLETKPHSTGQGRSGSTHYTQLNNEISWSNI